ncbi:MAG TPA: ammonia-forming cytochrome c nitrite reductase [Bacteroidales bacterium]|nr:ammonia-forming cytochrome c nitrite reductase [Bacteroidales bacterium]
MEPTKTRKPWVNWALFFATLVVVFLLGLLASSIIQRKAETEYVYKPKVKLTETEPRNQVWGENFPREYQSYLKTSDTTFRSKFNGSATIDELAGDPRLVVLWAGYAFSKDYEQSRGHYYAIHDIRYTLRTGAPKGPDDGPQPNTCWTCKSPDVPRIMKEKGIAGFYKGKWASLGDQVVNYIGCADCHDPATMDLRITRPALIEAFKAMGKDITKASHQEMRTLVCAQCHVEYYFDKHRPDAPEVAYLTFPWKYGTSAENALKYYDEIGFSDFTHQLSKAPLLKAQHPDYELFLTGIHAERGIACADCHMPYIKEGGQKFTSHRIVSPLANIDVTCQVCHRESEETLRNNVYERQERVKEIRDLAEIALVKAHLEAQAAWESGATDKEMAPALDHIRNAQWYWDYVGASHGASFHSPVEVSRIIGLSMDESDQARILLARILALHGKTGEIPYPDLATKEKAQKFIGLDMDKLRKDKEEFLRTVVPVWDQKARERESQWPVSLAK